MQVPSILQGELRTRLLQGIAIGAVASMVIGFSFGGWVTGATANKLAAERASRNASNRMPLCVEALRAGAELGGLPSIMRWRSGQTTSKRAWATRWGFRSLPEKNSEAIEPSP